MTTETQNELQTSWPTGVGHKNDLQAELNTTPGGNSTSPLTAEQATALNGRCNEIQRLLDSTLENEARAYYLLEQEKWKGDWTKDPNWEIPEPPALPAGFLGAGLRRLTVTVPCHD